MNLKNKQREKKKKGEPFSRVSKLAQGVKNKKGCAQEHACASNIGKTNYVRRSA